jgi:hypothetical protein
MATQLLCIALMTWHAAKMHDDHREHYATTSLTRNPKDLYRLQRPYIAWAPMQRPFWGPWTLSGASPGHVLLYRGSYYL